MIDEIRNPDDYVSVYTRDVRARSRRPTCLVVVDLMYATGSRDHGLGENMTSTRAGSATPTTASTASTVSSFPTRCGCSSGRARNDMRRVFLTYGSEVEDYSDLSPQMYELCKATRNRKGLREHELLDVARGPADRAGHQQDHAQRVHLEPDRAHPPHLRRDGPRSSRASRRTCASRARCATPPTRASAASLVEDATGTDAQEYHDNAILTLQRLYASVWSTDKTARRTSRRASRAGSARYAEGRDRRRWHVHRPHARRRRGGHGRRAQAREHPEDPSQATMVGLRELCDLGGDRARRTSTSCCTAPPSRRTSSSSATAPRRG